MAKVVDVDAVLKEMSQTKEEVVVEMLTEGEIPLFLKEDDQYSLEELISELEAEYGLDFNI